MKKKLLFIMQGMGSGGGERSLLTLLQLLDYEKYDVDLLLMEKSGLFYSLIPDKVNVLDYFPDYSTLRLPLAKSVLKFLAKGKLVSAVNRVRYSMQLRKGKSLLGAEQLAWKFLRPFFKNQLPEYDAAIAYLEGNPIYICVDCIKAKTKIGYIHSVYDKLGLSADSDRCFFDKLDYLVTVSPECGEVLTREFPEFEGKIRIIHNITSSEGICSFAEGEAPELSCDGIVIVSVGRLCAAKGYELAIGAARLMKEEGVNFKWFVIGKGEEREKIEKLISDYGIENEFILLGERANPYPYIKGCDIYAQTSRFEGKSIAIDEAKCLAKPIVVTCFSTVYDQISDGVNGLIAQMEPESIKEKIMLLVNEPQTAEKLCENLKKEKIGNPEEIEKFYQLIDGGEKHD